MDPDLKRELTELHALVRDNNKQLHSIRQHQRLSAVITVVLWIFALAIPVYVYQHYLQPVVSKLYPVFGTASTSPLGGYAFPTSAEVQKLLNSMKPGPQ